MQEEQSPINSDSYLTTVESLERAKTSDWFKLTLAKLRFLFIYLFLILFIGLFLSIFILFFENWGLSYSLDFAIRGLLGGFGMALTGSAIFYLRKLYKSSIKKIISIPVDEDEKIRALGVFLYFFLRPWFSIAFSLLIFVMLKSSVHAITTKETHLDIGIIYLMMFLGFFIGFASGDVIIYLETKAKDIVTKRISTE